MFSLRRLRFVLCLIDLGVLCGQFFYLYDYPQINEVGKSDYMPLCCTWLHSIFFLPVHKTNLGGIRYICVTALNCLGEGIVGWLVGCGVDWHPTSSVPSLSHGSKMASEKIITQK